MRSLGFAARAGLKIVLRLGILDFDSSHSIEFTRRINHAGVSGDQFVEGARVVMGVPGTSIMSPERIPKHAKLIEECGVKIVESPTDLLGKIDGALVLSVCGQAHLEAARPFLEAGLPTFVDKPFASSWEDAQEMADLAEKHSALLWSSSALRFTEEVQKLLREGSRFGSLEGLVSFGPAIRAEGNPGLFHYGIHAAELLFALMGPDANRVSCLSARETDLVTAIYSDGRFGSLRGTRRGSSAYGFTAFCEHGVLHELVSTRFAYRNLCQAIVTSFETNEPPVPLAATLKLMRFLLAANQSEQAGGEWISLDE